MVQVKGTAATGVQPNLPKDMSLGALGLLVAVGKSTYLRSGPGRHLCLLLDHTAISRVAWWWLVLRRGALRGG